jgi:hypothetical protein
MAQIISLDKEIFRLYRIFGVFMDSYLANNSAVRDAATKVIVEELLRVSQFFHEDLRSMFEPLDVDRPLGLTININYLGKPYESLSHMQKSSRRTRTKSNPQSLMTVKCPQCHQGGEGEGRLHLDLSARQ